MGKKKKQNPINLLPQKEFEKSLLGRILKWVLTTFRVMVVTVELVVIVGFLSRFFLDTQNSGLDDEITQKEAIIASYSTFEKEFKDTQQKLAVLAAATEEKNFFSPKIKTVAGFLPQDSQITAINFSKDSLEVHIASSSEIAISSFISNLRTVPEFLDVALTQSESIEGTNLISFTIKMRLVPKETTNEESEQIENGS